VLPTLEIVYDEGMTRRQIGLALLVFFVFGSLVLFLFENKSESGLIPANLQRVASEITEPPAPPDHPLSVAALRATSTPGSDLTVVRELPATATYTQSVVTYESEGNTIQALLTVPRGEQPESGWPVVIFNHGYIPPDQYSTTQRYEAYVNGFASKGYVVLKSDYRGHGESEGEATGGYGSNGYTIDVLNGVSSLLRDSRVDPDRVGMWGHSMGGYITLRSMVVDPRIKAGVIWGGVVASYPDLINNWRRPNRTPSTPPPQFATARRWRDVLQEEFGTPEQNPDFWNRLSANTYLSDLAGRPIQLHHGTADDSVPVAFSETLHQQLQGAGQTSELFTYQGDNHNISNSFGTAMRRSVEFFDRTIKSGITEE
jgi:dipeptidyl aminopeptidase/acylaminoacyl peptidase